MTVEYLDAKRIQGVGFPASTGSTADLTMNGDPTVVTSPTPPTGLGTQSLHFDGTGDYYNGVVPINSVGQPYSFSFWFQSSVGDGTPIGFGSFSTSNALMLYYQGGVGAGSSQLRIGIHGDDIVTSSVTINVDTWYHCVVTYDGTSGGLKMYVNGSSNVNDNTGEASPTPNADTIYIGGIAGSQLWTGEVDDVGYWNKVLSTTEVDELYNSGTGKKANLVATDKLVAYYGCNSTTQTNEAISDKATLVTASSTIDNGLTDLDAGNADSFGDLSGFIIQTDSVLDGLKLDTIKVNLAQKSGNATNPDEYLVMELATHSVADGSSGVYVTKATYTSTTLISDIPYANAGRTNGIQVTFNLTSIESGKTNEMVGGTAITGDRIYIKAQNGFPTATSGAGSNLLYFDVTDLSGATDITKGFTFNNTERTYTFCAEFIQNASSDLPENTIFNETDTYKQYWLQDGEWKINPFFESSYDSSTGWTQQGTQVNINDDFADHVGGDPSTQASSAQRVYRSFGKTLDDEKWYAQFELTGTAVTDYNQTWVFHLTTGTRDPYNYDGDVDGIGVQAGDPNGAGSGFFIRGWSHHTVTSSGNTDGTLLTGSLGTTYYCTLSRESSTSCKLSVRTGSHTGSHISGSPDTFTSSGIGTIVDINTIQHAVFRSGDTGRTLTWKLTNTKIVNGEGQP